MADLKPCPFCGVSPKHADPPGVAGCRNLNCDAWGNNDEFYMVPVEAWNRRAIPPNVARVIEEMEAMKKTANRFVALETMRRWLKLLRGENA